MGSATGSAFGASSAHKAYRRIKARAVQEHERPKTAALLEDVLDGLQKLAAGKGLGALIRQGDRLFVKGMARSGAPQAFLTAYEENAAAAAAKKAKQIAANLRGMRAKGNLAGAQKARAELRSTLHRAAAREARSARAYRRPA